MIVVLDYSVSHSSNTENIQGYLILLDFDNLPISLPYIALTKMSKKEMLFMQKYSFNQMIPINYHFFLPKIYLFICKLSIFFIETNHVNQFLCYIKPGFCWQ